MAFCINRHGFNTKTLERVALIILMTSFLFQIRESV